MKTETKPRTRAGQNLNVWLPDDIMDAFERLLGKTRRTRTAEVQLMMEQHLQANGLWPPDQADADGG
ncbi:MAG: hypothetical protein KGL39_08170 [Patescibacteria group bacterium]|nr:hypothetical protein [Patescibacteria group bacterium]